MKKIFFFIVVISAVDICALGQDLINVHTGPPGIWQELGTVTVSDTVNHDDIVLTGSAEFKSIKFKAFDVPINIVNVNIIYQNGKVDKLDIKYEVPAGGDSRIIDLKYNKIRVRRIMIWYKSDALPKGGTAKLALWGMKG